MAAQPVGTNNASRETAKSILRNMVYLPYIFCQSFVAACGLPVMI